MIPLFLAALSAEKPVTIGIGVAVLVVLYLAFKVTKFAIKMLLLLAAVAAIGWLVWSYYTSRHGAF
jgi:hypothetical protein